MTSVKFVLCPCRPVSRECTGGTAGAADWGVDEVVVESDAFGDDVLVQAWHVARVPAQQVGGM
jgi:hypothetical protein